MAEEMVRMCLPCKKIYRGEKCRLVTSEPPFLCSCEEITGNRHPRSVSSNISSSTLFGSMVTEENHIKNTSREKRTAAATVYEDISKDEVEHLLTSQPAQAWWSSEVTYSQNAMTTGCLSRFSVRKPARTGILLDTANWYWQILHSFYERTTQGHYRWSLLVR